MSARQTLGRGFGALIPEDLDPAILEEDKDRVQKLLIQDVKPNPHQPRRQFDLVALGELADSIKRYGIMQPLVVVRSEDQKGYRIVAGERRWRAAKAINMTHVPAIVRSLKELEEIELSLIENIQRIDLSPLEQALAVLKLQQQFNMTLEDISRRLGKAPSTVSNIRRLLLLPEKSRNALRDGKISEGHARAILALAEDDLQEELLSCILNNKWSVRQAEEFVLRTKKRAGKITSEIEERLQNDLTAKLGTKVVIKRTAKGGQLIIPFKDAAELEKLAGII